LIGNKITINSHIKLEIIFKILNSQENYSQTKRAARNIDNQRKMLFEAYFSTYTFEEKRLLVPYHGTDKRY